MRFVWGLTAAAAGWPGAQAQITTTTGSVGSGSSSVATTLTTSASTSVATSTPSVTAVLTDPLPSQAALPPVQTWCPSQIFCAGKVCGVVNLRLIVHSNHHTFPLRSFKPSILPRPIPIPRPLSISQPMGPQRRLSRPSTPLGTTLPTAMLLLSLSRSSKAKGSSSNRRPSPTSRSLLPNFLVFWIHM